jgi:hypothetical protein
MDRAGSRGWWLASDGRWYPPPAAAGRTRPAVDSRVLVTGGLLAAIVAGLALLTVVSLSSTTSSTTPASTPVAQTSPGRALFTLAVRDAGRQGWVHIEASATVGSKASVITGDAGPNAGQQTLRVGTQSATVLYVGRVAYVRVDSAALGEDLGVPSLTPAAVGQWVSFEPADRGYGPIIAGLTLPSALSELLQWPSHLALGSATTVDGQQVVPITGEARLDGRLIKATLDVTRGSQPLPVEINASEATASETVIFSSWGRPVTVTPPSGARSISTFAG